MIHPQDKGDPQDFQIKDPLGAQGPKERRATLRAQGQGRGQARPAVSPGLALLGLPLFESASLALPATRKNSPAAEGGRAARSAAGVAN